MRVEEDSNHMTSQIIVDTSANTVYNNTLRVRGRESGRYKCTVSNNRHEYFAEDGSQDRLTGMRLVPGIVLLLFLKCYLASLFGPSCSRASKSQCHLQDTYKDFTGVDVWCHTHSHVFLCGILSVWRRGLQCGLHH